MSGETEVRNVAMEESKVGSEGSDNTLVVLEFSPKAPAETKEWLTALIRAPGRFIISSKAIQLLKGRGCMVLLYGKLDN